MSRFSLILFLTSLLDLLPAVAQDTKFTFTTRDGLTLAKDWKKPLPGKPTIIMLHGLGSHQGEWKPFIEKIEPLGWGYFAYDARGHGASVQKGGVSRASSDYKSFGPPGSGSQWELMISDVGAAVQFLQSQGVDRKSIFLMGASLGANVALNYAALSTGVRGAVLLSPGLNYQGIRTETPVQKTAAPILIVASNADAYAYQSSQRLKQLAPAVTLWSDVKPGHGVQMFDENLLSRLIQWFEAKK